MKNVTVKNFFRVFKCPICREPLMLGDEGNGVMCRVCQSKWLIEKGKLCAKCSLPASECRCMPEMMSKAKVNDLIKLCFYDTESGAAADRFVLYMKDYRDHRVFNFAADELSALLSKYFEKNELLPSNIVFTYAPRSRMARDRHGFDQAEMLARRMSKRFGAVFVHTISRKCFSRRQKGLDSSERLANSKKSFRIKRGVRLTRKIVVLIDDIVTTGASLSVCAKLLRSAGAANVICASIASTNFQK